MLQITLGSHQACNQWKHRFRPSYSNFSAEIPIAWTGNTENSQELMTYTISLIAIHVGEVLLHQEALLLPDIYEMFCNKLGELRKCPIS